MQISNDKTPRKLFNIIRGLNEESKEIKNSEVAPAEKVLKNDTSAQLRTKEHQVSNSKDRRTPKKWTDEEEARFLKALEMFGRKVPKIAMYVGTRTKI